MAEQGVNATGGDMSPDLRRGSADVATRSEVATERDQSADAPHRRVVGRPFLPGNAGRPKGIKDRRSTAKEMFIETLDAGDPAAKLASARERWIALLNDGDPNIRLQANKFLFDHRYGKAKEQIEQTVTFAEARETVEEAAQLAAVFLLRQGEGDPVAN